MAQSEAQTSLLIPVVRLRPVTNVEMGLLLAQFPTRSQGIRWPWGRGETFDGSAKGDTPFILEG